MKRLLPIVFFSLMVSACGSNNNTTDMYDKTPSTEITSQPMQVDDSVLQPELSKDLKDLSGYWVANDNLGFVIKFEDSFLTLVDEVTKQKLSFFSDSKRDFGRIMTFNSYVSTQDIQQVNVVVDKSAGEIYGFTLSFGSEKVSPTYFIKANTSNYPDYQNEFMKTSL